ncbi:MAG TPA: Zn-dependent hydrolase [Terriglobales bacterium]|nr:Zn-dependent hydrolase [Terriglobales bacterium]
MHKCDRQRLEDKVKTFSTFGDTGKGGVTRATLSPEAQAARAEFRRRMEAAGATVVTDDVANMYATLEGSDPAAKRIAMASHADSVKCGGNYDGILGVLGGMEVIETISAGKIPHRHPITAMIWTNEEGAFYPPAMMCSGIVCGKYKKEDMLTSKNPDGQTFGEALQKSGYIGDAANRFSAEKYAAMFELHIEQGPRLEAAGVDVGVVENVIGITAYRIRAYGQSDHAGTTPMSGRRDALFACAKLLVMLHEALDKVDPELVYTNGFIKVHPCMHTIIPDFCEFILDMRHVDPEVLKKCVAIVERIPKEVAGCKVEFEVAWARPTVPFDRALVGIVKESVDALGYSNMFMNSGAGHDAQFVAEVVPTTMIFVPSKDGHSHCELEYTAPHLCAQGVDVLLNAVLELDKTI